jgi:hypothetical protein
MLPTMFITPQSIIGLVRISFSLIMFMQFSKYGQIWVLCKHRMRVCFWQQPLLTFDLGGSRWLNIARKWPQWP